MDLNTQVRSIKQKIMAFELALVIAFVSTLVIYIIDSFIFKHNQYSPLSELQFYGVIFVVVLGLVLGLLFYREEDGVETVESSEFHKKMTQKKLKKVKKAKSSK